MNTLFDQGQLPIEQFERLGLVSEGKIRLSPVDMLALLSGRRTNLIGIRDLEMNGFQIQQLDLKLSLGDGTDGKTTLLLHPIYKRPIPHQLLEEFEADLLVDGDVSSLAKTYEKGERRGQTLVIEYDDQTRSFVSYEPKQVQVPTHINGILIDRVLAEDFRNGGGIELDDGTRVQHRASEPLGLWANRQTLVLSFEASAPKVIMHGIRNFPWTDDRQLPYNTTAFFEAIGGSSVPSYTEQFSSTGQQDSKLGR